GRRAHRSSRRGAARRRVRREPPRGAVRRGRHGLPDGAPPDGRLRPRSVSALHLLADGEEIARRRALAPKDRVIEAWADLHLPGLYWLGDQSKATLDSLGPPLTAQLSIPADALPIYYGPQLCDVESL